MKNLSRIEKYGVVLTKLNENTLELVRTWRNSPKIMQFSATKEQISVDTHRNWFKRVDNENNLYFVIEVGEAPIGLINIKDIDYEKRTGESGIYIYEPSYLMGDTSFRAYFALHDHFFEDLQGELIYAHILRDNKRAIRFNQFLGLELQPDQESVENRLYTLTRKRYFERRAEITPLIWREK